MFGSKFKGDTVNDGCTGLRYRIGDTGGRQYSNTRLVDPLEPGHCVSTVWSDRSKHFTVMDGTSQPYSLFTLTVMFSQIMLSI